MALGTGIAMVSICSLHHSIQHVHLAFASQWTVSSACTVTCGMWRNSTLDQRLAWYYTAWAAGLDAVGGIGSW